jgi:hypothetical protein
VRDYLDRVRAVDGDGLSRGVTNGINTYLSGLISAQLLGTSGGVVSQAASVIKSHAILAGANTLPGCLVPVVGTAPTNVNFVAGDYNRRLGLGDPVNATKYLDTNRANTADPQNSQSISFYIASGTTGNMAVTPAGALSQTCIFVNPGSTPATGPFRSRSGSVANTRSTAGATGFIGLSRGSAASFTARLSGIDETITTTSQTPGAGNIFVFARNNVNGGTIDAYSNMRCPFYHVGENLNLVVLQSLQDQLFATLQAVIP